MFCTYDRLCRLGLVLVTVTSLGGCTPSIDSQSSVKLTLGAMTTAQTRGIPVLPYERPQEKVVEKVLAEKTLFRFRVAPLESVMEILGDMHKLDFVLDRAALEDHGIAADLPITITASELPLETALDVIVEQAGLTWTIHKDAVLVTTEEKADSLLSTRVYDVTDLVLCRDPYGRLWDDFDNLIETIVDTLDPVSWNEVGGEGAIEGASAGSAKVLVVAQIYRNHREIRGLLTALRTVAAERAVDDQPPLRTPPEKR